METKKRFSRFYIIIIVFIGICIYFILNLNALKLKNTTILNLTQNNNSMLNLPDQLSEEELKLIDEAGIDTTSTFEDALFPDGSNVSEWALKNDSEWNLNMNLTNQISPDCKVIMNSCDGFVGCVNKDYKFTEVNCSSWPKYSCYIKNNSKCEKQNTGNCSWTNTLELNSCVNNISNNNLRKKGETCGENIGSCEIGLKCAYPCGIQGCQDVCMLIDELPKP